MLGLIHFLESFDLSEQIQAFVTKVIITAIALQTEYLHNHLFLLLFLDFHASVLN
jgi:hypothetical protein